MSAFVAIAGEPKAPDSILWTNSAILIQICRFLKASLNDSDILSNDFVFCKRLQLSSEGLSLEMCSETVLAEVARLLFLGASPEHEYWKTWKSYFPHSEVRTVFNKLAEQILQSLEESKQRRDALSPKQRLCAALRFRAESGMRDFLNDHGLKLHELSKIKKHIDHGEWPSCIIEFLPVSNSMKGIAQRLVQARDQ